MIFAAEELIAADVEAEAALQDDVFGVGGGGGKYDEEDGKDGKLEYLREGFVQGGPRWPRHSCLCGFPRANGQSTVRSSCVTKAFQGHGAASRNANCSMA